ncbi:MAG: hypothetical protein KGL39_30275 [Patescibacteria group bacterium]|nr:hypothetical protein [Patescibacteria group bacterium]
MPAALIAQLIATLGPSAIQLIDVLIQKWQTNGTVTPDEWATLAAPLRLSAADHMKAQLAAAGVTGQQAANLTTLAQ